MLTKSLKRKSSASNTVKVCFQPLEPHGSSSSVNYEKNLSFRSHSDFKYSGPTLNRVNTTSTKSPSRWAGLMSFFPFLTSFVPLSRTSTVHSTAGGIQVHKNVRITPEPAPVPTRKRHDSTRIFKSRKIFIPSIVITDVNDHTNEYVAGDEQHIHVTCALPPPPPPVPAPWTMPRGSVLLFVPPVSSLHVLPRPVHHVDGTCDGSGAGDSVGMVERSLDADS